MGDRRKAVKSISAAVLVMAALIVLAPQVVFPVCEAPMHCYYSYMAEIGTSSLVALAAALTFFSKGSEAKRALSVVTAAGGVFAILHPSALIGVCGSPKMACHYGLLPVWNLLGGAIIILSATAFFMAKEENV